MFILHIVNSSVLTFFDSWLPNLDIKKFGDTPGCNLLVLFRYAGIAVEYNCYTGFALPG